MNKYVIAIGGPVLINVILTELGLNLGIFGAFLLGLVGSAIILEILNKKR